MSRDLEELSASGVKRYKRCPKQFWYRYLSDYPRPDGEDEAFLQLGSAVHDAIENVLKDSDISLGEEEELYNAFQVEENSFDYEYDDDEKVERCFQTASRWISSFVSSVNHVEEEWDMDRDGIRYKGLADLIADVEQDDDLYENAVVDWKTGSINDEWKERVQGGMYAELHNYIYGKYPEAIVFVYLDEETQSFHPRISEGEVFWNESENKYWTEIEKYTNQILHSENIDEWEPDPDQSKCYFCNYKNHCADSGIGAENVGMNEIEIGDLL